MYAGSERVLLARMRTRLRVGTIAAEQTTSRYQQPRGQGGIAQKKSALRLMIAAGLDSTTAAIRVQTTAS
jgi:hypothetical protein